MTKQNQEDYDNIYEISQEIFSNPPKPKKTIFLELEETCKNQESIFDIMLLIATNGMKMLFHKINPLELTEQEFKLLNKYFNSFGMEIKFTAECDDDRDFLIQRPDQLRSLLEAGYNFTNYKIYFDYV